MHDHRDALPAQRAIREAIARELVQDRRVPCHPPDSSLALLRKTDVRNAGPTEDICDSHGASLSSRNRVNLLKRICAPSRRVK